MKLLKGIPFCIFFLPSLVKAQTPTTPPVRDFKESGWELGYGYDEELDESDKAKEDAAKKAAEEKKLQQEKDNAQKDDDFFGGSVDALKKSVETDEE